MNILCRFLLRHYRLKSRVESFERKLNVVREPSSMRHVCAICYIDNYARGPVRKLDEVRIALLTTDNRENYRHYELAKPCFGSAPTALLQGFAETRDLEVH